MVTVDMLLSAMREGEVPLFVALFAKIAKLREYLVQRLLFEPGGEGLAIACRAIGLSGEEFKMLFRYVKLGKGGVAKKTSPENGRPWKVFMQRRRARRPLTF